MIVWLAAIETSRPPAKLAAARKESPLSGLKQPVLGILATVLIMAIRLGFISLFDYTKFSGVVSCFLISLIPMEIVMGVIWGMKQPRFAAERSQPVRGILFAVIARSPGVVVDGSSGRRRRRHQPAHAHVHHASDRFSGGHVLAGHHVGRLAVHRR